MNIFILEDDLTQQYYMETIVEEIIEKHHLQYHHFEVVGKPKQLLEAISEKGSHQIFFLDIEIKTEEEKGLDVAKKIREIDPYAIIVFVTSHSELMPTAFKLQVGALDYLDKSLSKEVFKKRIETALLHTESLTGKGVSDDALLFETPHTQIQVPFKDILYIETSSRPHRLVLYTHRGRTEFTANLSDILKKEKRFYQCHRSFVVNPANVHQVDKVNHILHFQNGATCLISRAKIKGLTEAIAALHLRE
ncbi:response regulator transcription factor [uncultured Streptococcus sp.]|uniref:response regulator transcription factor n=1 Tax=uncultured Streptococcus sp. TaxID=83427 RepID=UPI00280A96A6|nr:response regulator transcription factor [uncultured Streptococcus sp.]